MAGSAHDSAPGGALAAALHPRIAWRYEGDIGVAVRATVKAVGNYGLAPIVDVDIPDGNLDFGIDKESDDLATIITIAAADEIRPITLLLASGTQKDPEDLLQDEPGLLAARLLGRQVDLVVSLGVAQQDEKSLREDFIRGNGHNYREGVADLISDPRGFSYVASHVLMDEASHLAETGYKNLYPDQEGEALHHA